MKLNSYFIALSDLIAHRNRYFYSLPFAHNGELRFIDALFTATSAVCVTGLIVKDTPVDFTSIRTGNYSAIDPNRRSWIYDRRNLYGGYTQTKDRSS
jgi:hypothetical protein